MSNEQGDRSILAFLLGAAMGAGLALLLAPKSGEETRRQLANAAKNLRDEADSRLGDAKGAIRGSVKGIEKDVGDAIAAGRDAFESVRDAASRSKV